MNRFLQCTFIFILIMLLRPLEGLAAPIIGDRIQFDGQAFEIEKQIGAGGFGKIYQIRSAKDPDIMYALKVFSNEKERVGMSSAQTRNARNVAYQRVIQVDPNGQNLKFAPRFIKIDLDPLVMLTPLEAIALAGHPLKDLVVVMPLATSDLGQVIQNQAKTLATRIDIALKVVEDILPELAFLSNQGLVHNDIKPENILVSKSGKLGLSDFDAVVKAGEVTSLGTPYFNAPERMGLGKQSPVYPISDVYSLGIVVGSILAVDPENPYREIDIRDPEILESFLDSLNDKIKEAHPELTEPFLRVKQFLEASLDSVPARRLEKMAVFTSVFKSEKMVWHHPVEKFDHELELLRRGLKKLANLDASSDQLQRTKRLNPQLPQMLEILGKDNSVYIDALLVAAKLGIDLPNEKFNFHSKVRSVPFHDLQQIEHLKAYLKIKSGQSADFVDSALQKTLDFRYSLLAGAKSKNNCLSVYLLLK